MEHGDNCLTIKKKGHTVAGLCRDFTVDHPLFERAAVPVHTGRGETLAWAAWTNVEAGFRREM